jgi:hypothetical protein
MVRKCPRKQNQHIGNQPRSLLPSPSRRRRKDGLADTSERSRIKEIAPILAIISRVRETGH